jgi:hypothetical protein
MGVSRLDEGDISIEEKRDIFKVARQLNLTRCCVRFIRTLAMSAVRKPCPPIDDMRGSTTVTAIAVAMAASKAFPRLERRRHPVAPRSPEVFRLTEP